MKSNNVKFNQHTGNYVLLDFGLAVMSDEQRRTSLRRAGAIEFMAPEQSEGLLLFQSDVYSFGIILFELLAGVVPFPLHDKGESARNQVMLAHLETPPPDLRELRKKHLPDAWADVKKTREMQVPEWLVSMIYRCLRKKPEERFANGKELHDYIVLNSTIANNSSTWTTDQLNFLRQQNEQLQKEKEQLQQTILKYQQESTASAQELQRLRSENDVYQHTAGSGRRTSTGMVIAIIIAILSLGGFIYVLANRGPAGSKVTTKTNKPVEQKKAVIAKYRVQSPKAYFHTKPDESTKRGAYLYANDPINAYADTTDFVYTEFTNSRGQTSKGWLRKIDLLTEDEWNQQKAERQSRALEEQHKNQLRQAQQYLDESQYDDALAIYKQLVDKDIPEAIYHYANMMLQNQHNEIDCATAWSMLEKAADRGWIPAKTTMGYLLMFAENRAVLSMNNYNRCEYKRDLDKALKLLNEAAAKGDDTAKGILDQFHISNQEQ